MNLPLNALAWPGTKSYISLGAGVQSSTVALMFACGELGPMPDGAIFADTQSEPESVYAWLKYLTPLLPFPVHTVTAGNLEKITLRLRTSKLSGQNYVRALVPAFFARPNGKRGLLGRKCTAEFKVRVLKRQQRKLAAVGRLASTPRVTTYIGISTDEAHRMKPSQDGWNVIRWPLIEANMTRNDCLAWMKTHGYPRPPRSACYFCPFHSDEEWSRLKTDEPKEFAKAIVFDNALREIARLQTGTAKLSGDVFLHSSLKPLQDVTFATLNPTEHMGNECEGLCGV